MGIYCIVYGYLLVMYVSLCMDMNVSICVYIKCSVWISNYCVVCMDIQFEP